MQQFGEWLFSGCIRMDSKLQGLLSPCHPWRRSSFSSWTRPHGRPQTFLGTCISPSLWASPFRFYVPSFLMSFNMFDLCWPHQPSSARLATPSRALSLPGCPRVLPMCRPPHVRPSAPRARRDQRISLTSSRCSQNFLMIRSTRKRNSQHSSCNTRSTSCRNCSRSCRCSKKDWNNSRRRSRINQRPARLHEWSHRLVGIAPHPREAGWGCLMLSLCVLWSVSHSLISDILLQGDANCEMSRFGCLLCQGRRFLFRPLQGLVLVRPRCLSCLCFVFAWLKTTRRCSLQAGRRRFMVWEFQGEHGNQNNIEKDMFKFYSLRLSWCTNASNIFHVDGRATRKLSSRFTSQWAAQLALAGINCHPGLPWHLCEKAGAF